MVTVRILPQLDEQRYWLVSSLGKLFFRAPDFREEFVAWYMIEHMPILLECPQWDGCRFVETSVTNGCQFYSLHQLNDRAALDSAERKRSRSTPWFKRLAQNDWFDGAFTRTLYRRPE